MWRGRYGCGYGRDYATHGCPHGRACHRTADCGPDDNGAYPIAYSCFHRSALDSYRCTGNRSSDARAVHPHASRRDKDCAHGSADPGGGSHARPIHTGGDGRGYACNDGGNYYTRDSCRNAATRAAAHPNGSATTDG